MIEVPVAEAVGASFEVVELKAEDVGPGVGAALPSSAPVAALSGLVVLGVESGPPPSVMMSLPVGVGPVYVKSNPLGSL